MIASNLLFECKIEGRPIPWKAHQGFGRRSFNPLFKEREYYKWIFKGLYHDKLYLDPLRVSVVYAFKPPKSWTKKQKQEFESGLIPHTKKPDIDNCTKFLFDCLKGTVFQDDNQVWFLTASKVYASQEFTKVQVFTTPTLIEGSNDPIFCKHE